MSPKLPVPDYFFTCPPLTMDAVDTILDVASRTTKQVIEHACVPATSCVRWTRQRQHQGTGMDVYTGMDPSAPRGVVSSLVQSQVHATLDEVASLHYCANTAQYKQFIRIFHDDIKDGIQLYTLARPSHDHPRRFVGVNWAVSDDSGMFARERDWCFVESHDDAVVDGKRAWVRSFRSIQLPCCPDLQTAKGFVRAEHYRSGIVYVETDVPGVLDVRQLHQVALNGALSKLGLGRYVGHAASRRRSRCMVSRVGQVLMSIHLSFALEQTAASFQCTRCDGHCRQPQQSCRSCHKVVCRQCVRPTAAASDRSSSPGHTATCIACAHDTTPQSPSRLQTSVRGEKDVVLYVGPYDLDGKAGDNGFNDDDFFDTWTSSCPGNLNSATVLGSLPRGSVPRVGDVYCVPLHA